MLHAYAYFGLNESKTENALPTLRVRKTSTIINTTDARIRSTIKHSEKRHKKS